MFIPPLIERELRITSRRWTTYWSRFGAGAAVILVGAPMILVSELSGAVGGGGSIFGLGPMLFQMFSVVACFTALAAGWFFATDAIAQERREGTLGLLFLAPVRPRTVVFGKLVTASLRGTQWLLAAVPLFALPILLGGVQGRDFIGLTLAVFNTLFWSMTSCLWASARSQSFLHALTIALILHGVVCVAPVVVDLAWSGFSPPAFVSSASLVSPAYNWINKGVRLDADFWSSFAMVHAMGWVFLAMTLRLVARQLRHDPVDISTHTTQPVASVARLEARASRERLRSERLDTNPLQWLVERERGPRRILLGLTSTGIALALAASLVTQDSGIWMIFGSIAHLLCSIVIVLLLAALATRFFVEARKTGALELLLVSPVSSRDLVRTQLVSLLRMFAVPVVLLLATQIALGVIQIRASQGLSAAPQTAAVSTGLADMVRFQWLHVVTSTINVLTGYFALAWTGLWMGLVCRQASTALFATVGFVKVAPYFLLGVLQTSLTPSVLSGSIPAWVPALVGGLVGVGLNLGLVLLARYQLLPDLRRILGSPASVHLPGGPPSPPPVLAS